MKKYFYLIFLLAFIFFTTSGYAANSETVIQTNTYWNQKPIKAMHLDRPQVTILKITIPAGEKLSMHKHPMLNVGYMIKGELTVYSEQGEKLVLKAGDPIVELVDTWHYGENTGSEDVVLVVTYVGNKDENLSIKK
jgi:quercetin dioxygenase-like cupin family protein